MANKATHVFCALAGIVLGYFCGAKQATIIERKTLEVLTRTDTIIIHKPIEIATVRVRTDTILMPLAEATADSAAVIMPIEQTEYSGEGYRAWVSGYRPTLDSIALTRHTTTIRPAEKRFGIGIQAGIGLTPAGIQPYLGIGLHYRFHL